MTNIEQGAELIIQRLNDWRAALIDNIADEPPFTDDLNGPVQNLPPLEGRDLEMLKMEIEELLAFGWTPALVERYTKYHEEVCPFWAEAHALDQMNRIREKANGAK